MLHYERFYEAGIEEEGDGPRQLNTYTKAVLPVTSSENNAINNHICKGLLSKWEGIDHTGLTIKCDKNTFNCAIIRTALIPSVFMGFEFFCFFCFFIRDDS